MLGKLLKLVIVTAGTAKSEANKNERRGVGHIVQSVMSPLDLISTINHVRP